MAVTPVVAATLVKNGFTVNIEDGAGAEAKFRNEEYESVGANLVNVSESFKSGKHFTNSSIFVSFHVALVTGHRTLYR